MPSISRWACLLLASTSALAQLFEPEEVKEDVASMLEQFRAYTEYGGPIGTILPAPTQPVNAPLSTGKCDYWLDDVKHQGIAAFNSNPSSYQVFRNVKDFGAKGDGVTDDTAAINSAISAGNRCAPGACGGSTVTPALVYFPQGTYMVSDSIIDYYFTQLIGNPNCKPTIKALPSFAGALGVIDGDPYQPGGASGYGPTNVFWRQIRNFVIDMTLIPATSKATGIHWPTGQATSLQNVVFKMSEAPGTQHQGIFIENGSGGFMTDLVFYGGLYGVTFGNQQFTMRNFEFYNCVTAINQIWDWGWTYSGMHIHNCSVGLNMSAGGVTNAAVGSVTFIDSNFVDTDIAIVTTYSSKTNPPVANSLILENVVLNRVKVGVKGNGKTVLAGSSGRTVISAWGEGHSYTPNGPKSFQGKISANQRPSSLTVQSGKYYVQSKPQYEQYPASTFLSARSAGAKGNGKADDTAALQKAINTAVKQKKILFIDQGDYLVTNTIYIPSGARIVGEAYPVILSSGKLFNNMAKPVPVVQVGKPGEKGSIEWSDTLVSTQGQQEGAILIEYNLASPAGSPSGIWDVHTRIGGFTGSSLQVAQCPTTPNKVVTKSNLVQKCIAGYMSMHITPSASGLYMENNWLWTADHDVDSAGQTQITVYNGRGLLDESKSGTIWLVGTAVEHHTLYQYSFVNTKDVFAGQIQTETPYYQPNPSAPLPFPYVASLNDPQFGAEFITTNKTKIPNADAWGLRVIGSSDILIYGAGLYSFFDNYSTACSAQGNGTRCQSHIADIQSSSTSIYNLNTVGTHYMLASGNSQNSALWADNQNGFVDTIALYR